MKKHILFTALVALAAFQLNAGQPVRDTLEFTKSYASGVEELLRGAVSGVRVSALDGGGAYNTAVRGLNSLRGNSSPLWVVDGVVLSSDIDQNLGGFHQYGEQTYTSPLGRLGFISPYDIESIEVLKDITATAIYGARGANGVIIINTKNARSRKFEIDENSNVAVNIENGGVSSPSISHNHHLSIGGVNGGNRYRFSTFIRNDNGILPRQDNLRGGVMANFDARGNKTFWFGLNALFSVGKTDAVSATSYFGHTSFILDRASGNPTEGWVADYDDQTMNYRSLADAYLRINFAPQLYFKASVGVDFQNDTRYLWYGNGTAFGLASNGAACILSSALFNFAPKAELNYDTFIGPDHHLTANLRAEYYGNKNRFNNMTGGNFFTHEMRARGISITQEKAIIRKFNRDLGNLLFGGTISYDYKKLFGATLTYNFDRNSRFDDSFNIYPAVEAYVNILEKARISAGFGEAGRETFVPYEMFGNYVTAGAVAADPEAEILFEGFGRLHSTELHFTAETLDLGPVDAKLTYFRKDTDDSFTTYCFGEQKGAFNRWFYAPRRELDLNRSSLRSRGIELDLDAEILNTADWKWTLNANLTLQSNQVSEVSPLDINGLSVGSGLVATISEVGYAPSAILGYEEKDGAFVDHTSDGIITEADRIVLGGTEPSLYGGLSTSLKFKGLVLDVLTDYALGHNILNMNRMFSDGAAAVSSRYVEKGDFWRISRVSLGYKIPMRAPWIQELGLSLSVVNPLVVTSYSGVSPDVDCFGISNFTRGIDYGACPAFRSVVLGVNLKF